VRIAVCIKRVPDSGSRIRIAAGGLRIETADLKFIISPYDEMAIEEGLRLKESSGAGEILVISLGPADVQAILRQALAMGADRAVHLLHEGPSGLELDGRQCALALAQALREEKPDLVLFGKSAIDDQNGQVGALTAAELGIPCVGEVVRVEWSGQKFRLHHQLSGQIEVVEAAPPVAVTAQKGLNEPRYAGIKGIMAAKKKPLVQVPAAVGSPALELLGIEPPPPRRPGRIVGEGASAVDPLIELLHSEAKVI